MPNTSKPKGDISIRIVSPQEQLATCLQVYSNGRAKGTTNHLKFMALHVIKITVIVLLISLCMFLPYLLSEYGSLAPTLSFMTQLLCFTALLLVPIGILWMICQIGNYRKKGMAASYVTYYFAIVTLIALAILVLAVSLTVFVSNNPSLAIIILLLFIYFYKQSISKIKILKY